MEEIASESEEETSPLPVSSKRRQRIESDVSLTDHPVLQRCSATSHNPRQSTSSISSQECSDFGLEDEVDKERAKNQRLQRVILASDSSSESGEGIVQETGTSRVKRLGARQRSHLSIKANQYQHSSIAVMFDAPAVDMCSLEETEAVSESCSSPGLNASYSTLPRSKRTKQPQRSRNTRNQTSVTRCARAKPSRKQDLEQGFVSKRKKIKSEVINSFCNNQKDGSESDVTSPLLSPKLGLQNDKTSTTYGQHNRTLASWEKIAFLGEKSTKGPMLFAHEHLQDRLPVQEEWMIKARFIWSQWKKLSREARSVYTATAKRNRMERSPRNRYAGHKVDPGSSQEYTSVSNSISSTSRPVQMTFSSATATTVQSTYQPSSLPTNTVPPVTQRVTQLASQYFQEHSLPGGMSFNQPSFGNSNMFSPTEMSHAQGIMDTSLSCQSLPSAVSSRSVGLPGDYCDRSVSSSALASTEKDKSIKPILSSTNLKPVYRSTAEATHVLSGVSSDDPLSKQSVTPTLSLPLFVTPVTPVERTSLVSPSSSLQSLLSQPILHRTTSKQQYSIAGMQSDVSHHGLQNRPKPSASVGSNKQSAANSYSIATMHFHRSSATVHHKPTSISSSAGSLTSASVQQAAAFMPTTISSPVNISSSFSPSITNPSSAITSFSPTIPSILASSSKPDAPSTSVGLTKVSDEWRRILLERVKEIGIKKQANKKNKPKSKKKQKQCSDSLSQTSMSTGGSFAQSPKMSPTTAFPFFPEVSQAHTFPLCTTVQSEIIPSSNPSSKVSLSINEHKCLVADEPSELHNIIPVGQNVANTMGTPPATSVLNSMGTKSIGSPCSTNSSPLLSPSTPVTPIFNSASSACNYADLERHYWQCLIQLEHQKQYTEMVHQHLKEAFHHQQIMLLQSDKYQEFLHKLVPPDLEPRQLDKLNHSTGSLPKYEFGGTFDKPIMKIIS